MRTTALLGCGALLAALLTVFVAPASSAATCTTPFGPQGSNTKLSAAPIKWATTDGNVLVTEVFASGTLAAVGGNFTKIVEPSGKAVAAKNLAVIRVADGVVVKAFTINGYPRTVAVRAGVMYVGGGITGVNGTARKGAAAISTTDWRVLPWAPAWSPTADGSTIRSIQVSAAGVVYLATNGSVVAVKASNAAKVWRVPVTLGAVRALLLSPSEVSLYVGGLFDTIGGVPQHGLAKLNMVGAVDRTFKPTLRRNSMDGTAHGTYDGENGFRLEWNLINPSNPRLVLGSGGSGQAVSEINHATGVGYWWHGTEGDTQGLAVVGNTIVSGFHRNHGNTWTGCDFDYYTTQWVDGTVLPWDSRLTGLETKWSYDSGANGGVGDIAVSTQTRRVIIGGDFSFYGQTCNIATRVCAGGTPQRGLAVFTY